MHNLYTTSVLALLLSLVTATASADTQTVFSENFDDASHFTESTTVPDGWASTGTYPLSRQKANYFGRTAYSGEYVMGTMASSSGMNRDEVVYTKPVTLEGGKEYTFSFRVLAPGGGSSYYYTNIIVKAGTAQSSDAMTTELGTTNKALITDWTLCNYKFTPEVDGDYVFGLFLDTQLWNSGVVLFDDIELTSSESAGEDDDKVVVDLPYSQSFDNENGDYDGTTYVPKGWLSVGSAPFTTASIDDLAAQDGTYYLIAPESSVSRDDRIYTPFFDLKAGTEYNISFYVYMPGDGENATDLDLTVGTEQDSEFHTKSLLTLASHTNTGWELQTVTFTPEEDGRYCFSVALSSASALAGEVCLDLFKVTSPGLISKPKASFGFTGNYNIMTSSLTMFSGSSLQLVSTSTDADTYKWSCEGATLSSETDENPSITFIESGDYTIFLTVANAKGESTTSKNISVDCISDEASSLGLYGYGAQTPMSRDATPCWPTHEYADWVIGVNHYYNKFAERYNVPEGFDYEISSATVYLCWYGLASRYYSQEAAKPVKIVVYGEKDGRPDLNNVYGSYESTMSGLFGTTGLSKAEMRGIPFGNTITAKGPFYLAFEFADDLWISETDANLSRTVFGVSGYYQESGETTLYAQPYALPEGATCTVDGGYWPVDKIDSQYKGLAMALITWMNVKNNGSATSIAVAPSGKIVFATRLIDGTLTVSGTQQGETVSVFNANGQTVAQTVAAGQSASLSLASAPAGVYIVKTAAGTQKLVKH